MWTFCDYCFKMLAIVKHFVFISYKPFSFRGIYLILTSLDEYQSSLVVPSPFVKRQHWNGTSVFKEKPSPLPLFFCLIATEMKEMALCSIIQVFLEKTRGISLFAVLPVTSAVITIFRVWSSLSEWRWG